MSDPIPNSDLVRAAQEFAITQIDIVSPRIVICLGVATYNAVQIASGLSMARNMETAIDAPFTVSNNHVLYQAHTGHFGQISRNKGGVDRVSKDWLRMRDA